MPRPPPPPRARLPLQDIRTSSESCVTTLTSDRLRGDLIIAGCGDGYVRAYDRRMPAKEAMVMALQEHRSWIVGAGWQRLGDGEVVTGRCARRPPS